MLRLPARPAARCAAALVVPACLLAGCGQSARYQTPGGTDSIVNVGDVNAQDIANAADEILGEMLATGVLRTAAHQPARLRIERFVNDTSSPFPEDLVLTRMRERLVNSGQAQVVTAYGDDPESAEAQARLREQAFREGRASVETLNPDFFLTGKITQIKRSVRNARQSNYYFQLTLTEADTGLEAFTKLVEIQKGGTRDSVGF